MPTLKKARFELGRTLMTPGARDTFTMQEMAACLVRHISGDWGDMDKEDKRLNDRAVTRGDERIFSAYKLPKGKLWVLTEADRSATTMLLPSEY